MRPTFRPHVTTLYMSHVCRLSILVTWVSVKGEWRMMPREHRLVSMRTFHQRHAYRQSTSTNREDVKVIRFYSQILEVKLEGKWIKFHVLHLEDHGKSHDSIVFRLHDTFSFCFLTRRLSILEEALDFWNVASLNGFKPVLSASNCMSFLMTTTCFRDQFFSWKNTVTWVISITVKILINAHALIQFGKRLKFHYGCKIRSLVQYSNSPAVLKEFNNF